MTVESALECMKLALQKLDSVEATTPAAHLAIAIDSLMEYMSACDQAAIADADAEISQMIDEDPDGLAVRSNRS